MKNIDKDGIYYLCRKIVEDFVDVVYNDQQVDNIYNGIVVKRIESIEP